MLANADVSSLVVWDGAALSPAAKAALSPAAKAARALAACLALAAVLALPRLGERGIFSPAEARYALIARAMLESGDWVQPRLNGVRYDEKPPLLYWSIAAAIRLIGPSDAAVRLPSALGYVGTAGLTFAIARELLGPAAGPVAAVVYATSVGTLLFGRFVSTDTLLGFFLTLSLLGLCAADRRRGARWPGLAFAAGAALAGLTKGLFGVALPLAVAATFALVVDRSIVRRLRPGLGAVVFAALFLPWHVALAIRDPSFARFYLLNEHVYRFFNAREPIDYVALSVPAFWAATLFWLLPWALFLPRALGVAITRDGRRLAPALLWSGWIVGTFTLASSRLEYYALPALPALAVVLAAYGRRILERGERTLAIVLPLALLLVVALAATTWLARVPGGGAEALTAVIANVDGYYREYFASHPTASFALLREALALARPFAALLAAMAAGALLAVAFGMARAAFAVLVAGTIPCLLIVDVAMRMVGADRSQRELAQVVNAAWSEGTRLVVAGPYEDLCGITYYTGRPTEMLDPSPRDLLYGFRRGDSAGSFLSPEEFRRAWSSPAQMLVLSDPSLELPGAVVLAETPRSVLRANHPRPRGGSEVAVDLEHGAGDGSRFGVVAQEADGSRDVVGGRPGA